MFYALKPVYFLQKPPFEVDSMYVNHVVNVYHNILQKLKSKLSQEFCATTSGPTYYWKAHSNSENFFKNAHRLRHLVNEMAILYCRAGFVYSFYSRVKLVTNNFYLNKIFHTHKHLPSQHWIYHPGPAQPLGELVTCLRRQKPGATKKGKQ